MRFIAAVPERLRIRATSVLKDAVLKGNATDVTRTSTVEVDGGDKPAVVAHWITRLIYG